MTLSLRWLLGGILLLAPMAAFSQLDSLFSSLSYRSLGPSRGGRVTAVTGIPEKLTTFYFGSTGGGVWHTDDGGMSWDNISDGFLACGSIGSIEVAPSDPNVIYVGTGSASPRGNVSPGCGLYRSRDAGKTWQLAGLPEAGQIGKLQIHPQDPDLVYAAVLGKVFGKNDTRGVYRSRDGGDSWQRVLFHSDSVGAIDLVMDPNNPRILYAGLWRVERKPWTLIDGAAEGGLYKSTDGGDSWTKLPGQPDGVGGRVGVAVSPANSQRVWMIREMKDEGQGGLWRSDDGGQSWERVNREHKLRQRAWYYSRVFADPQDAQTVYVLNTRMYRSDDGGKTFTQIPTPHGDNHCLWINPGHPEVMVQSNDGGANVSFNGGRTWSTQNNQPTAEFYRVSLDQQFPFRVYGAQQDNSTISVPSHPTGAITPQGLWYAVGGGESGHIAVDPRDPNIIYAGNYIGQIDRVDRAAHHVRNVVAYPQMHDGQAPRDIRYRFQWNAPIRLSVHNPDVLYHCSQYVHCSTDGGQSWAVISPDLTTNNDAYQDIPGGPVQHDHTGVELYTTIFALEESPHAAGELWAGTDDGRVWIRRTAEADWAEITPAEMPSEGTVNSLGLSPHRPGKAWMAVYRYRDNDVRPYLYRTDDYGQSWTLLSGPKSGIPQAHFARVLREDPMKENLLYAGTEFGLYVSMNGGNRWEPFQRNLPVTPVTDLAVREEGLVIATQGRSFWMLDDLAPLRQWRAAEGRMTVQLMSPATAYRTQLGSFRGADAPDPAPEEARFFAWLAVRPDSNEAVRLEIRHANYGLIRAWSTQGEDAEEKLSLQAGLNAWSWDLRGQAPDLQPGSYMSLADTRGALVPPDDYVLWLIVGGDSLKQTLEVKADPRWPFPATDLHAQYQLAEQCRALLDQAHEALGRLRQVREQIEQTAGHARSHGLPLALQSDANELSSHLSALEKELIQTQNESGQDPINYPSMLDDQIAYLYSTVNGQDARPTEGCYQRFRDLKEELAPKLARLADLMEEVGAFEAALEAAGAPRIWGRE